MNEILQMSMEEMAGCSFSCTCGSTHSLNVAHIAIGEKVLPRLLEMTQPFLGKRLLLFSDTNTHVVAGQEVLELLQNNGYNIKSFCFATGNNILVPNEAAMGRMLMELEAGTGLLVAVGSGTLNDLTKYLSARTGIPYIIVGTAPSMDGYLSDGAPLICSGFKHSYPATLAYGVVGDIEIMCGAPLRLIRAGYGDVLGKITALAEWQLAVENINEYYCPTCATLVRRALERCTTSPGALQNRQPQAIAYLMEALVLTGVAMGLIGLSRPASGSEHILAHFWEMAKLAGGKTPELHGIQVGVATPIIARLFELLRGDIPSAAAELCPPHEQLEALLAAEGIPTHPRDIGIDKDLFYRSLREGYAIRERHTLLRYAHNLGKLEYAAQVLTERVYS